jgi:3-oxoacyl-[acyl-carrier protein] reductase
MVACVLDAFNRIDILVNNARVGGNTPFLKTSLEEWNRIIGINLTGAFLVVQGVARHMVKIGGGKIVKSLRYRDSEAATGGRRTGQPKPVSNC